ncbi:cytochrome P450 monooxygenase [Poronia punctata]|nr:cytochrome P450 monooxygenase [Poronia punctata]
MFSSNMKETVVLPFHLPSLEQGWSPQILLSSHPVVTLFVTAVVIYVAHAWSTSNSSLKKLPHANPYNILNRAKVKWDFLFSANTLMRSAAERFPNQPYRMLSEYGDVVVLPTEWADEIRNDPHLSFMGTFLQEGMYRIPGFEPIAALGLEGELVQLITRKQLTKQLNGVTAPLAEEAALAMILNFGESTEWREIQIIDPIRDVVARMSSRVFLGDELCRDENWLRITKNYTIDLSAAIVTLMRYPVSLRRHVARFYPECARVRDHWKDARDVIVPVIEKREAVRRAAAEAGKPIPRFNDALDWIDDESRAKGVSVDVATFQLILTVVAINTTTDLVQNVLVDLIQHPDALQAVRHEIVRVLKVEGWKKTSIYNMKLLDSVIKESQRLKPIFSGAMRRAVEADTALSDGTLLKKGSRLYVDTRRMTDPKVYANPEEWQADRFLQMRSQPGKDTAAQLVTTSIDHLGWGHGLHACPGRFFAANEVKIALIHMLMKYDWKLAPDTDIKPLSVGFSQRSNPHTKVVFRRRETVEFDIDSV